MKFKKAIVTVFAVLAAIGLAFAQVQSPTSSTPAQLVPAYYPVIPISATAAVNVVTTLTIPAPTQPNLYNYVCSLGFNASQNATSTANSNQTTSSTNFNSFALKYSLAASANINYDWYERWGEPATGCVKSVSPGTATTFVSAQVANTAFTWYATYYQAP